MLLIMTGTFLVFLACKIYRIGEQDAYIQQHSPLIRVPIAGRINGLGTVRSANKIFVRYKGKRYTLESSNRHFRKTARLDSINVHFDEAADRAVLPNVTVTAPYLLLILITTTGMIFMGYGIVQLRKPD